MYTIGKLARKFHISRSTLLYYDSIGLLTPSAQDANKYRMYSDEDYRDGDIDNSVISTTPSLECFGKIS